MGIFCNMMGENNSAMELKFLGKMRGIPTTCIIYTGSFLYKMRGILTTYQLQ